MEEADGEEQSPVGAEDSPKEQEQPSGGTVVEKVSLKSELQLPNGNRNSGEEAMSSQESDSSARGFGAGVKNPEKTVVVEEGRRCGLCGGLSEPPELAGIAAAMKDDPNSTVGRAGLGRLLGPLSDRTGLAAVWVHQECAVWSPEVYFLGVGCLKNVRAALRRGRFLKCSRCGQPGATIGCRVAQCPRTYHLPCARLSGCSFNHKRYLISCAEHVHLFLQQDKKRLRECMIGLWEDQNTKKSSKERRFPADDKIVDNAEDEEFLKRERKRLHRDLARLAPVNVGGSSQGDAFKYEGWESVGGLQNVVQCLKEMVTLPLLYPDIFQKVGIVPPRGVLLHGYPGTGKTLVVRALLGACARGQQKIAYFSRKGADCLGKYVGDSERQLRLLFQLAEQSQPSIIFFDEIDGLAPKRTKDQDQTHSSVVSTLLALMDGLSPRGSVVVIGATNRPDAVDPALRRAGRFDREIFFPLPSVADREAILRVHTRCWKKRPSPELLSMIAKSTIGYAGADLQALCAQAAMNALKRSVCLQDLLNVHSASGSLPDVQVKAADWLVALAHAAPPCSRRMLGNALSEIDISPLPQHLVPVLLRPVVAFFLYLDSDGRFPVPYQLKKPLASVKEMFRQQNTTVWSAPVEDLEKAFRGTGIFTRDDFVDARDESENHVAKRFLDFWTPGSFGMLLSGAQGDGKGLVAASILHMFQSCMQVFVLNMQTLIQAGSGEISEGLIQILREARAVPSVVYMPRIDAWAFECDEEETAVLPSKAWGTFLQHTSLPSNFPLLFLATCEEQDLPPDILSFFVTRPNAKVVPSACIQIPVPSETEMAYALARAADNIATDLKTRSLTATVKQAPSTTKAESEEKYTQMPTETPTVKDLQPPSPSGATENAAPIARQESCKQRTSLMDAIRSCGYQLLHSPHCFAIRQATTKLGSGPSLLLENPYTGCWVIKDVPAEAKKTKATQDHITDENDKIADGKLAAEKQSEIPDMGGSEEKSLDEGTTEKKVEATVDKTAQELDTDDDSCDENRRVWGLEAVGLKACKGFYQTAAEVVSEVKAVMEAMRERLSKKLKSRKRQWQCCQLLAQAAALQDLMECWAHELRRLEARDRKCKQLPPNGGAPQQSQTLKPQTVSQAFQRHATAENVAKKLKVDFQSFPVHPFRSLLLDVWDKQGRSLMAEEVHDLISEASAAMLSELDKPEPDQTLDSMRNPIIMLVNFRKKLGLRSNVSSSSQSLRIKTCKQLELFSNPTASGTPQSWAKCAVARHLTGETD